ncbi:MAG TPA: alpha/beta fold hydrolase [Acidimicrobiales bacterium]|nr:alpha/beta fold hydrolase [Acidimicrobiales bacterium]
MAPLPLLLTHGFASSSHAWAPVVAAFEPERRCIAWDVRGHGQADYPADPAEYSIPLTLGDMEAILDREEIDRAVLVGHSMGGYLSLEFQKAHPSRVAGLVLVGTGPGFRKDDARESWNEVCETYASIFQNKGFDGLRPSAELDGSVHRGVDGLINAARGILRQRDAGVIDNLPNIDVPTLIVVGSEDKPFRAGSDYMAAKIPGSRAVVVDGAPHAPMLTHPEIFNAALAEFLHVVG